MLQCLQTFLTNKKGCVLLFLLFGLLGCLWDQFWLEFSIRGFQIEFELGGVCSVWHVTARPSWFHVSSRGGEQGSHRCPTDTGSRYWGQKQGTAVLVAVEIFQLYKKYKATLFSVHTPCRDISRPGAASAMHQIAMHLYTWENPCLIWT